MTNNNFCNATSTKALIWWLFLYYKFGLATMLRLHCAIDHLKI
jgi:hypothetical protein